MYVEKAAKRKRFEKLVIVQVQIEGKEQGQLQAYLPLIKSFRASYAPSYSLSRSYLNKYKGVKNQSYNINDGKIAKMPKYHN